MKKIVIILISLILILSCVGPEEPLDGLSKNTPIIVNTNDAFTFSLQAENYSTEENYNLTFPNQNPIEFNNSINCY